MTPQEAREALKARGYVYEKDIDAWDHPKRLKITHPKTYQVADDNVKDGGKRADFVIGLVDFEGSMVELP